MGSAPMEVATTRVWRTGTAVSSEELRTHDETLFQAFVERHLRFVFSVAYAMLRNRADADDVTQECFLRVYRKRAWTGIEDERAWLARIAWRLARDRQRKPVREEGGVEMDTMTATEASPEAAAVAGSSMAHLHRLIDALPEELRQPLVLASLEGMTSAQAAAALGIPEGTVRTRIQRARLLLKQKMEGRHAR